MEKNLFDLYYKTQHIKLIELNEENEKNNQNKKVSDNIIIKFEQINKEIKYVKYLNNIINEKILLYKENSNINKNSNLNKSNKNNNNFCKNALENNLENNNSIIPSIAEIANTLRQKYLNINDINNNNIENFKIEKENISQSKKEENNLFEKEYIDLFNNENNNKNSINFEFLPNKQFTLRKSSFMSDYSDIRDVENFKDTLFE